MRQRVKNLTNSPYDLPLMGGGSVRLPAFGEVEGEFAPDYVALLRSSAAVELVSDLPPVPPVPELPPMPPMPVDTTGDGVPEMPPALPGLPGLPGAAV